MHDGCTESHWYAIQVGPKKEDIVALLLNHKGYEQYVPTYYPGHQPNSKDKIPPIKLFPGYVFCRFSFATRGQVRNGGGVVTTPGVLRILGGAKPMPIPPEEIEAVQLALAARLKPEPWPFQIGRKVKIEGGPLKGISGIVVRSAEKHRLVLSIELLNRSLAVTIESEWVSRTTTINEDMAKSRECLAAQRTLSQSPASSPIEGIH